ncbi:uncharacterized protein LTR77_010433 [Saxophila tyrrhenica]|uniref:Uncharacterized protein n=1 Tax=Saxophila tyrrhenica TaxID=1690608 RepID=A0AAV9NVE8_9PEZI|nr:hypothetical protein LTR77_010433 [Saxophila tyrrhenica]
MSFLPPLLVLAALSAPIDIGAAVGLAIALIDKRTTTPTDHAMIFQFDAEDLRLGDLRRLSGLVMNATDSEGSGAAVFSSQGDGEHEGFGGMKVHTRGLETEVNGTYIAVPHSMEVSEDDEEARAVRELHEAGLARAKLVEEPRDVLEAFMQLRKGM